MRGEITSREVSLPLGCVCTENVVNRRCSKGDLRVFDLMLKIAYHYTTEPVFLMPSIVMLMWGCSV